MQLGEKERLMAAAETNEALSAASSAKDQPAVPGARSPRFRYLRTTSCRAVGDYPLLSIDRAMELARLQSLSNQQGKARAFIARSLLK